MLSFMFAWSKVYGHFFRPEALVSDKCGIRTRLACAGFFFLYAWETLRGQNVILSPKMQYHGSSLYFDLNIFGFLILVYIEHMWNKYKGSTCPQRVIALVWNNCCVLFFLCPWPMAQSVLCIMRLYVPMMLIQLILECRCVFGTIEGGS